MSVDIDWSLLSGPGGGLADGLLSVLNAQLNTAARPSFLGPVTVSSFDFGTAGPSVEIKDVRDVWRAFDDGDDEGDAEAEAVEAETESEYSYEPPRRGYRPMSPYSNTHIYARTTGTNTPARPHGIRHASSPHLGKTLPLPFYANGNDDDNESVYSLGSRSRSVASVGIGMGLNLKRFASPTPLRRSRAASHVTPSGQVSAAHSLEPASPPARPEIDSTKQSNVPSVQMHLRVEHAADMSLTICTSLQVNYPSALFMSLPLKLVITGLTIAADVVVAYSSRKNRVHMTIVDEEGGGSVGQRILPHLHIESEIGHADAHVLRNVGKVEKFIVDVLRKTLVEELVFPNFHTIAL